jgi:hypothetical protein
MLRLQTGHARMCTGRTHWRVLSGSVGFVHALAGLRVQPPTARCVRGQLHRVRSRQGFPKRRQQCRRRLCSSPLEMQQPSDQQKEETIHRPGSQPDQRQQPWLQRWRIELSSRFRAGIEAMGRVEALLFFLFPQWYMRNLIYERDPAAPSLVTLWYEQFWEYIALRYEAELRRQSFLARPLGCLLRQAKRDVFNRERRVEKLRTLRQYRCRRCHNAKVVQCKRCDGSGIDPDALDACPRCRATGKHPCPLCSMDRPLFPPMFSNK